MNSETGKGAGHLASWLGPHRRKLAAVVGTVVVDGTYESLFPLGVGLMIDRAVATHDVGLFTLLAGALGLGFLLTLAAQVGRDALVARITADVVTDLRLKMEAWFHREPYPRFRQRQRGDVATAFGADLARVEAVLLNGAPTLALGIVGLGLSLITMTLAAPLLGLMVVVGLPLCLVVPGFLAHLQAPVNRQTRTQEAEVNALAEEHFSLEPLSRGLGLEGELTARFQDRAKSTGNLARRLYRLTGWARRAPGLSLQWLYLVVVVAGAWQVFEGQMALGVFAAFNLLFFNVYLAVSDLSAVWGLTLQGAASVNRVADQLGSDDRRPPPDSGTKPPILARELTLREVVFGYVPGPPVLAGVTLVVPAAKRTAVVGTSGSGKSTLAAILAGLVTPDAGTLEWDGVDWQSLAADRKKQLGIVFQDALLLDATVRENVLLGHPAGNPGKALEAAGLAGWVADLPEGLETRVGPEGRYLSGGQRQRLALARALARDPDLLILDEVTSALDPLSERHVHDTLRALSGKTIVHITHRLEGIRDYDHIIVLDKGRVVETGTHDDLVARGGTYAHLWNKQSGIAVSPDAQSATLSVETLRSIPLFATSTPATLAALAANFVSEIYQPGQTILLQGTPGSRFFVVARGRVDVVIHRKDGDHRVASLEDGDFFGEMSLLNAALTTATVTARLPTVVLALEKTSFFTVVEKDHGLVEHLREAARARKAANEKALGVPPPILDTGGNRT